MNEFGHQLLSGISNGGIYASIALALVMIYRSTHIVNLAQGEMAMASTYLAWMLIQIGVPFWLALAATIVVAFCMGAFIEWTIMRPLRKAPEMSAVIAMLGVYVILNSVVGLIFGYEMRSLQSPFSGMPAATSLLSNHELGVLAVTGLELAVVFLFFRYSSLGLAMRAAAQNQQSSRLVGINVGRMLALGWGLAAGLGALAGVMAAPILFLEPSMMSGILLYAFASALLGGISSPAGAVAGGFIMGVVENLAGAYLVGTQLKLSVALLIIVAVVVLRPAGLFGKAAVVRV